jgi:hypothetical protein
MGSRLIFPCLPIRRTISAVDESFHLRERQMLSLKWRGPTVAIGAAEKE